MLPAGYGILAGWQCSSYRYPAVDTRVDGGGAQRGRRMANAPDRCSKLVCARRNNQTVGTPRWRRV